MDVIEQPHYKKIRDFTEQIFGSYTAIESLQQRVLDESDRLKAYTICTRPIV